jgi:hypothetical protein
VRGSRDDFAPNDVRWGFTNSPKHVKVSATTQAMAYGQLTNAFFVQ